MKPHVTTNRNTEMLQIAILIVFTTIFRLVTLMIPNTGIDESDYWNAAKSLQLGLPYPELTHRTVRWSLILPVYLTQFVFGIQVNAYYALPILAQVVQNIFLYLIGKRLHSRLAGILAVLAITVFPYSARVGSQVRPEVVSIVYVLVAFWFLLKYFDSKDRRYAELLPSVLFLYLAYHAKITNLFFLPGFLFALWIMTKQLRSVMVFGGTLFSFYIIETGLYALLTDFPLGHLEIIATHHIGPAGQYPFSGFFALFYRYAQPYLQWYWQIPFALFALVTIIYLLHRRNPGFTTLLIVSLSFFFFMTFSALSLNPLRLLENFINRYFYAVLGFVLLALSIGFLDLAQVVIHTLTKANSKNPTYKHSLISSPMVENWIFFGSSVFFVGLILLALLTPPGQRFGRYFAWDPRDWSTHALSRNNEYRRILNTAVTDGIPVVASTTNAGANALRTVSTYYLDEPLYRAFQAGAIPSGSTSYQGQIYLYVSSSDFSNFEKVVAVVRGPFEARLVTRDTLPAAVADRLVRFEDFE